MAKTRPASGALQVRLADINEPGLPIRQTMDEVKLAELAESIRDVGMIEPLVLRIASLGRYEIIAGHRRYLAAGIAGLAHVPAVLSDSGADPEAVKLHENIHREDLNVVEEGEWFLRLLESRADGDCDKLAEMVKRSREYVEDRLLLMGGDADVLAALRAGRVNFSVARELNRIKDRGYRLMYLEAAISGGATARVVRQWRMDSERLIEALPPAAEDHGKPAPITAPITTTGLICFLCQGREEVHDMELLYGHRVCLKVLRSRFLRGLQGGGGEQE